MAGHFVEVPIWFESLAGTSKVEKTFQRTEVRLDLEFHNRRLKR